MNGRPTLCSNIPLARQGFLASCRRFWSLLSSTTLLLSALHTLERPAWAPRLLGWPPPRFCGALGAGLPLLPKVRWRYVRSFGMRTAAGCVFYGHCLYKMDGKRRQAGAGKGKFSALPAFLSAFASAVSVSFQQRVGMASITADTMKSGLRALLWEETKCLARDVSPVQ